MVAASLLVCVCMCRQILDAVRKLVADTQLELVVESHPSHNIVFHASFLACAPPPSAPVELHCSLKKSARTQKVYVHRLAY